MNIVTNTTAWPSVTGAANSATASTGPAVDVSSTAVAPTATTQVQGQHHHRHHGHHDDGDEHSGHHDQQAYMALQIKVEQTFSALTAPGANQASSDASAPAADGEDGGGFAAMLKAKFSTSEGGMSASLSIRMSAEGQASGGDMAAQMQGFVQTLYAALHTLFGGSPTSPTATAGTPVTTGAAAALADAATPAAAAGTGAAPAAAADAGPAADAAATAGTPAVPVGAADTPASTAPASSSSLSIKLRLTYNSFGSQLGSLTQQLAQPGAANAAPGMAGLLGDLSTRFEQMLSLTSGGRSPSLNDFLDALAKSFAQPASATPSANTATQAPTAEPATPATDAAAASLPTTPGTPALAPYGQVLSFSVSMRSQWLMAA